MTLSEYTKRSDRIKEELKWKREELSEETLKTFIKILEEDISDLEKELEELEEEFLESDSSYDSTEDGINDWNDTYEEEAIRRNK